MTKTLDYVITFAIGLTAGVLCAKSYYENKYKTLAEEEIASVKEAFKILEDHKQRMSKIVNEEKTEDDENYEEVIVRSEYSKSNKAAEVTDYHTFYKTGTPYSSRTNDIEVKMAEKEFPREEVRPRIISQEDYDETELSFDKMSCTFYIPDRIVVDDLSREVVEPDLIGEENIEYIFNSSEPIICIRNELISVDMEISKDNSSAVETGDVVWPG